MIWQKPVKNWHCFRNHEGCQVCFCFFVDVLPKKNQSRSGKICASFIFEIFKSPFCKQILLWFCRFCRILLKPYLTIFQINRPMVPFMCDELMKILDQLLHLIFCRNALEEADTALKKFKRKWLTDESHHLEDGLVDLGAATKNLLEKTLSFERKRKFKGEWKMIVLNLLLFFFV